MIGPSRRALTRAYSIASANTTRHLEFFSIKVPNGPLTSRLQHLRPATRSSSAGSPPERWCCHDLKPAASTCSAPVPASLPFLSVIRDPETYERFDRSSLVHGVRWQSELAYSQFIEETLPSTNSRRTHQRAAATTRP